MNRLLGILLIGGILTIIGFFVGAFIVPYTMSLPLIRKTSNAVRSESALPNQFAPREYSDGTLYAFMKSRDVIVSVVEKAKTNPKISSAVYARTMLEQFASTGAFVGRTLSTG